MIKTLSQTYTAGLTVKYSIPASNFRLLTLSASAAVDVRFYKNGAVQSEAVGMLDGFAQEDQPFDAVEITSATAQTVVVVIADGHVKYDRFSGSVSVSNLPATQPVSGSVSVSNLPATQPVSGSVANTSPEQAQIYGASYKSVTGMAANSPDTIFTAAQNANGAVIHRADLYNYGGTGVRFSLLAKATAPTSVIDGDVIAVSKHIATDSFATVEKPIKIPAGKGLFYISDGDNSPIRSVLYTLL